MIKKHAFLFVASLKNMVISKVKFHFGVNNLKISDFFLNKHSRKIGTNENTYNSYSIGLNKNFLYVLPRPVKNYKNSFKFHF